MAEKQTKKQIKVTKGSKPKPEYENWILLSFNDDGSKDQIRLHLTKSTTPICLGILEMAKKHIQDIKEAGFAKEFLSSILRGKK